MLGRWRLHALGSRYEAVPEKRSLLRQRSTLPIAVLLRSAAGRNRGWLRSLSASSILLFAQCRLASA